VALDNGRVLFSGPQAGFANSAVMQTITYSSKAEDIRPHDNQNIESKDEDGGHPVSDSERDVANIALSVSSGPTESAPTAAKAPRKLIEDEARATGRIKKEIVRLI
jgi:hypothetical protein